MSIARLFVMILLLPLPAFACTSLTSNSTTAINASTTLCGGAVYNLTRVQLNADGIVFNCNGSTLDGGGVSLNYRAIQVNSNVDFTNVTNCTIQYYQYGYYLSFTEFSRPDRVFNNTFFNNTYGVYNLNNYYLNITGNNFTRNEYGVEALSADRYHIQGNVFVDQRYNGIRFGGFSSVRYVTISGNRFWNNVSANEPQIDIEGQFTYSVIEYNAVEKSIGPGIGTDGSLTVSNVTIRRNNLTGINGTPFQLYMIANSIIHDNYINSSSPYYGMQLWDSSGSVNIIENNTVMGNGSTLYGMYLFDFDNATIRGNSVRGVQYSVYEFTSASHNNAYNNLFNDTSGSISFNATNVFNATQDCSGTNIMGGSCIGGNFWARPGGGGFSQACSDGNSDGFCDSFYNSSGVVDYLPLSTYVGSDTAAPAISSVQSSATNSSASISWTTDEVSNSSASYGTTLALGARVDSAPSVTSHAIGLDGLLNGTVHYFNVTSCDSAGNCNTSGPYNFTTLPVTPVVVTINWPEWDANTTNLTSYDNSQLANISNVTFSNGRGSIRFPGNVSITEDVDVSGKIVVAPLSIFVNSSALPAFNTTAVLVFRNVTLSGPVVKRDGADCGSSCSGAYYDSTSSVFNVNVTGFSNYTLAEQCSDGVQNYDEAGPDCGGSCTACAAAAPGSGGGGSLPAVQNTSQNSTLNAGQNNVSRNANPHGLPADAADETAGAVIEGFLNGSLESITGQEEPIEPGKDWLVIPALVAVCFAYAAWMKKRHASAALK